MSAEPQRCPQLVSAPITSDHAPSNNINPATAISLHKPSTPFAEPYVSIQKIFKPSKPMGQSVGNVEVEIRVIDLRRYCRIVDHKHQEDNSMIPRKIAIRDLR